MRKQIESSIIIPRSAITGNRFKNVTGKRFGKLLVVNLFGKRTHLKRPCSYYWNCICDCGRASVVCGCLLRNGTTRSCGCLRIDAAHARKTHRMTKTGEYNTWATMIQRCTNPNATGYKSYGGRGIRVCKRWFKFDNFFEDMGLKPSPKLTLERVNNGLGYNKKNCRWATMKQQQRNRRNNHLLSFEGQTMCVAAWAEVVGIRKSVLYERKRLKWSDERTLIEPFRSVN